ncbi:PHD-zinc-finger like domain-containing protein [Melanogaster broomeanus]|nr:PHD-zinc-finger like domain-containing protein [Melanogaster broomeanus]
MTRGFKSPGAQVPLPKVSFVLVQDEDSAPAGVHDQQARSYGYNDFSEFQKPDHYIRYIEPLEKDLAIQVEYDMDEQDQEWLDAVNTERRKDQINLVTYETFEIIMDRLEKEYFDLTKNIPKPDYAMPSEDSTCAICDDSEGENSNAIVFCDGCNLAVHQDCYGVPYIPEGQWLCRKCTVSPENPVSCILCPNEGGAFKQTVLGDWAHLLCAIWIPETRVANEVFMEPITGSDKIPKQRWKLKCSICGIREGACIQCTKTSCFLAFHATCARKEKLLMPMKSTQGSEPVTLTCYCEKHLPKEQAEARLNALAHDGVSSGLGSKLSKSARAYAKTYKTGPPSVPQIIVDRILNYVTKINVRKKPEFVHMVCKYWSLKREARRGAPLLKRLHLEPWTASNVGKMQTEEEKTLKLEHLERVRKDLETLRELTLLCRKRESRKLAEAEAIQSVLEVTLFPHEAPMRLAFERILALDRNGLFKHPVSRTEVPDYYDVVQNPMTWDAIDRKLDCHEYWDFEAFKSDVELVLSNAVLYNKPGTSFYKTAQRMQTTSQPILQDLVSLRHQHPPVVLRTSASSQASIGDFEAPLEALQLLISQENIQDDINLVLETDPLSSLFAYELGRMKPPPPPPPPKPKPAKKKLGRPPKAAAPGSLDISPGFRAPRTRRALAAAAAFEAEAAGGAIIDEEYHGPVIEEQPKKSAKWRRGPTTLPDVRRWLDLTFGTKSGEEGRLLRDHRYLLRRNECGQPNARCRNFRRSVLLPLSTKGSRAPLPPEEVAGPSGLSTQVNTEVEVLMDVGGPPLEPSVPASPPEREPEGEEETQSQLEARIATIPRDPYTKIIAEHGRIIVEELDTPATRREKAWRRKAEKAAAASQFIQSARVKTNDHESDLSSLSELESEEGDGDDEAVRRDPQTTGIIQLSQPIAGPSTAPQRTEPGAVILPEGKTLEGGTLVWGKADTYPWWPAVVYEPDDERIPVAGPETTQWIGATRLLLLGEDLALDAEMLAPTSRRQRWKTANIRKDCRDAYARAIAEMETEADATAETADAMETEEGGEVEASVPTNEIYDTATLAVTA